jgi:hypothetical protein
MRNLFSYVVDHDEGYAPHPTSRYCTLVWCKYKKYRRSPSNIVELAKKGDWIVGTGGTSAKSAGPGRLIYAMRVDEKMFLADYCKDKRFSTRFDACPGRQDQHALISKHFFYFGGKAIRIPKRFSDFPLEQGRQGFRYKDFTEEFIDDLVAWLEAKFPVGMLGQPCQPDPNFPVSKCPSQVRRKGCTA